MGEILLDHAGLEILDSNECRSLLAATPVGRIAFVDRGEPVILPITIGTWNGAVVFSTAAGSKLEAAVTARTVAVEIDGWDETLRVGWSVLVKGTASTVDEGREIAALDRLSVTPWVRPEIPKTWVRVLPTEVTGRRIPTPRRSARDRGSSD